MEDQEEVVERRRQLLVIKALISDVDRGRVGLFRRLFTETYI